MKFLVYVDRAAPYPMEEVSAMAATIKALDKHPAAERVEVKPWTGSDGRRPVKGTATTRTFHDETTLDGPHMTHAEALDAIDKWRRENPEIAAAWATPRRADVWAGVRRYRKE